MKKYVKILAVSILIFPLFALKNDAPAYRLFKRGGKEIAYKKMLKAASEADVVLFGEQHNNPISHWLQIRLTKDLHKIKKGELLLSAEMFEADNQLLMNEYLAGKIKKNNFEKEAKLWDNYKTDYKPLVEFAKKNGLQFVAANVPRRYAAAVAAGGFEALEDFSEEAKKLFAPLPISFDPERPSYKKMKKMMGNHGTANMVKAQALKDVTMATNIAKFVGENRLILHFDGAFHSDRFDGIYHYLKTADKSLKIITVSTVEQKEIKKLDENSKELANFIICVPADMTKTY